MSKDERIKYGSLEHQVDAMRATQARQEERIRQGSAFSETQSAPEVLPFSDTTRAAQEAYEKEMEDFESRQRDRASQSSIPVDDKLVQLRLRELGEPIILFGEQPPDRRERLKQLMAHRGISVGMPQTMPSSTSRYEREKIELFFTEGSPQLKEARLFIAKYSIPKAQNRLEQARKKQEAEDNDPSLFEKEKEQLSKLYSSFEGIVNLSSQVGDDRPLSFVQFSPKGEHLLTSSWTGQARTWQVDDTEMIRSFGRHSDRALCAIWHPHVDNLSPSVCNLATSGADGKVLLFARNKSEPLATLEGHEHRVPRVAFHPSGNFLASASLDRTWKLWDVGTESLLLEQEGHAMGVNTIGFQGDGSLIVTGGADAIGRVWDLRSGKTVYLLRGHNRQIFTLDWNPNGYQIITGGEDNTIRIWDVRKKRNLYVLPAHEAVINHVSYHADGNLIFSSSVDNTIRLWNGNDWTPIKIIKCLDGKIMNAALSPDMKTIITANYDRTWKKYGKEEQLFAGDFMKLEHGTNGTSNGDVMNIS